MVERRENIRELFIEEEMKNSYLSYAMSVIMSRALPDVRDGLKPSQRRVLVAMNDLGLLPRSKSRKCATIVGETMGKYHPPGHHPAGAHPPARAGKNTPPPADSGDSPPPWSKHQKAGLAARRSSKARG